MKSALVIGSGSIAKRHIKNLRKLYPTADIMCVSASSRDISCQDVGATSVETSIYSALCKTPDIAIVASPTSMHLNHANKLLEAGIPTLIEKPLCLCIEDVARSPIFETKIKIGVAYNLRYFPILEVLHDLLTSNELGLISSVSVDVGQYLPDWRPDTDYRKTVSAQQSLGGGVLLELSHELDYINWLFGGVKELVSYLSQSNTLDIDVEDNVESLMYSNSGFVIRLHMDFLQREAYRVIKIVAEKGTLECDLIKNEIKIFEGTNTCRLLFSNKDYDRNEMYIEQLKSFVAYSKGKSKFKSPLNNAVYVMKLIEAIRISNKQHRWVQVEEL